MSSAAMTAINRSYSISDDNGWIFAGKYYIPEEVLSIILSYVTPQDLVFTCRLVCKYWCNVIDSQVWRIKFGRENLSTSKVKDLPWFACYWILLKNPFERNLVKNNCGQENLKHWNIISNEGEHWKVEKSPVGIENFPKDMENEDMKISSCFATSFGLCSKEQIIDLRKAGAVSQVMDLLQPKIMVSEWYCARFDCDCLYEFKTAILDRDKNPIDEFEIQKNLEAGSKWQKVSHTFQNYGQNVCYIWIYHSGQDSRGWVGHYGSKMTGSSVTLQL